MRERKIKGSFINGELFVNADSLVRYINSLPLDDRNRSHYSVYMSGANRG